MPGAALPEPPTSKSIACGRYQRRISSGHRRRGPTTSLPSTISFHHQESFPCCFGLASNTLHRPPTDSAEKRSVAPMSARCMSECAKHVRLPSQDPRTSGLEGAAMFVRVRPHNKC